MPVDPARLEVYRAWLGEGQALLLRLNNVLNRIAENGLEGDITLTPYQRTALRDFYDTWQSKVTTWFGTRP